MVERPIDMITEIKLRNWKSHEDSTLTFEGGTNVLVGIMGSGKSAILDAVTYGLFGTVPAVKDRTIALDDLIMKRPIVKDSAEVEVSFVGVDGENYVVKRVLKRDKGTTFAELRNENGDLINKPKSTEVTEDVSSLLGIEYDFFERMVYAKQNELDNFLSLSPRERRKRVDELLKIDRFENARKNSTTLINRVKSRKNEKLSNLKDLQSDEDIDSLDSLRKSLENKTNEKEELEEKKGEIDPDLDDLEDRLEEFEENQEEIDNISRKVESINGKVESIDEQLGDLEDELDLDRGVEEIRREKEKIRESLDVLKNDIESLEDEYMGLTRDLSKLRTEMDSLEGEIADLEEKISSKEEKRERLESKNISELKEKKRNIKNNYDSLKSKKSRLKGKLEA